MAQYTTNTNISNTPWLTKMKAPPKEDLLIIKKASPTGFEPVLPP